MKKLLTTASALTMLFTVMAVPALAKGTVANIKAPFYDVDVCDSDHVTDTLAGGKVIMVTPNGSTDLVMQGNVKGLTSNTEYQVWVRDLDPGYTGDYIFSYLPLGYYKLVTFTTDDLGDGSFHINFSSSDLKAGDYKIQVAINTASETYGCTVIATKNPINITVN